jgi:hypothetical protein
MQRMLSPYRAFSPNRDSEAQNQDCEGLTVAYMGNLYAQHENEK